VAATNDPLLILNSLYQDVDQQAHGLEQVHSERLVCRRGCCMCCVDELTVFEVEAANIRQSHANLLQTAEPHPPGACAFLDQDGACRIYEQRPYVCRTQGLPLRWLDEDANGEFVEYRDICPLNDEGDVEAVEDLPEDECWSIGPIEERLAKLQLQFGNGKLTRVPLRSLFE
jgi:Fe-S-cluster containining protein